jgi:hypothetical protein
MTPHVALPRAGYVFLFLHIVPTIDYTIDTATPVSRFNDTRTVVLFVLTQCCKIVSLMKRFYGPVPPTISSKD